MSWDLVANVVIAGVLTGMVYGLMALGLSVIFGVVRVVNFAHGEMMTIAMYAAVVLFAAFKLDPFLVVIPVAAVFFVFGYGMQALVKVGMRVTTKTAARLVPVAGQAVSAGLSYSAMRFVGGAHARDCARVIEAIHAERGDWAPQAPPPSAAQRLRSAAAKAASRWSRKPRA